MTTSPDPQLTTLPNGFRIVSEAMPGLKSAAVGIWVQAGGRHERIEQNGIAHFLEHMAFKGTQKRSTLQIAEAIEDVGGYINAYTSREVTAYYARVLESDVALAVDVIADILRNPVFDPNEIEVERGVILQEIGQALDTPDDVVFDWLQEQAFDGQALGRTILGPTERVRSFARDDFFRFVEAHYNPQNMVLAAAGAVDHAALVKLAEALFGDMQARPRGAVDPAEFTCGEARMIKPLEQVHFALALPGHGYLDDAVYTGQVYATAMGGGMSSRLFQEVREKRGLCYSIFAQAGSWEETGMLTLYAGTSATEIAELTDITLSELRRSAADMSSEEVARARAQMKSGLLMGLESPSARAERLARLVGIWGRVPPLDETLARIDAVTTGDVKAYAGQLCSEGRAAAALYGPAEAAPRLDEIRERLAA
ncbi:M16 family metallopeptidase [Tropicimonas sp. S265A]|uniref:M16 family metallopeptidase n=1 Tax=Tropicimonas sp. S265A TaxID=3415134 RepID=UPI003C7B36D8